MRYGSVLARFACVHTALENRTEPCLARLGSVLWCSRVNGVFDHKVWPGSVRPGSNVQCERGISTPLSLLRTPLINHVINNHNDMASSKNASEFILPSLENGLSLDSGNFSGLSTTASASFA